MVIKKNNSRELFDRQKVLNGMLRSCAQRPVSYEQLEQAVSNIEQTLLNGYDREVSSVQIGELAMQELTKIDEVVSGGEKRTQSQRRVSQSILSA